MYFEEKIFKGEKTLEKGEYENCRFLQCQLASADLLGFRFIDCVFEETDLSMARIEGATFQDVFFKDCKLLGVRFDNVNNFGLGLKFDTCRLDHASFVRLKLKKAEFKNSNLTEVDFTDTQLSESVFDSCNLAGVIFDSTNLEKTDLRTSFNFSIDPEKNKLKGLLIGLSNLPGLLEKYNINIDNEY